MRGKKEALEFALEVGGKDALTKGRTNLLKGPETTSVKLILRGLNGTFIGRTVDIDEFTFPLTLENVLAHEDRSKIGDAQFLANFTKKSLLRSLTIVKMTTYGSIPLAWLDVFPCRTLLQIDIATSIEDMKVDNGMKQARAAMALSASGLADYRACFINYGEYFPLVVLHYQMTWKVPIR